MTRQEEDDALGHFMLLGAVGFLCFSVVVFAAWMGWLA